MSGRERHHHRRGAGDRSAGDRALLRVLVPLLAAVLFFSENRASAQETEIAQLRQQISELRTTLERVDASLQRLEHRDAGATVAPLAPAAVASQTGAPPAAISTATSAAPARAGADANAAGGATETALSAHERALLQDQARALDAVHAWREIQTGMRQEQVLQRLGKPQSVLSISNRTGWVYTYAGTGSGSVFFNHDGVVISTMAPARGAFSLF